MTLGSIQPGKTLYLIQEKVPGSTDLWKNCSAYLEEGEVESLKKSPDSTKKHFEDHEAFYYGQKHVGKLDRRVLKLICTEVEVEGVTFRKDPPNGKTR